MVVVLVACAAGAGKWGNYGRPRVPVPFACCAGYSSQLLPLSVECRLPFGSGYAADQHACTSRTTRQPVSLSLRSPLSSALPCARAHKGRLPLHRLTGTGAHTSSSLPSPTCPSPICPPSHFTITYMPITPLCVGGGGPGWNKKAK